MAPRYPVNRYPVYPGRQIVGRSSDSRIRNLSKSSTMLRPHSSLRYWIYLMTPHLRIQFRVRTRPQYHLHLPTLRCLRSRQYLRISLRCRLTSQYLCHRLGLSLSSQLACYSRRHGLLGTSVDRLSCGGVAAIRTSSKHRRCLSNRTRLNQYTLPKAIRMPGHLQLSRYLNLVIHG